MLKWLLRTAWHNQRGPVAAYLAIVAADLLAVAGFALGLRSLIQAPGILAAGAVAVCWGISAAASSARANLGYLLAESLGVEVDDRILHLIAGHEGLEHLEHPDHVDRIYLLTGKGDVIARTIWLLVDVWGMLLRLAVVLVILALIKPVLLLLAILLVPALALPRLGQQKIRRSILETAEESRLTEHLFDVLSQPGPGMEIRIAAARKTLEYRAAQAWESVTRRQERAYWKAAWLGISGWTVFAGGYAAALLLVMHSASPADVLVLVTLTAALRTQAEGTVWASLQVADGMHLIECFDQVASALWQLPTSPGAAPVKDLSRLREGIRLRQVSFTYPGTASAVLHDLDLDLPSGTTIAVVGEHGSGKTTLMKLLCGLYRPTTGSITADGTPLTRLPTTAGFQDFARFAFVARESVGVGDLSALNVDSRLEQAMADGGATDFIARLSAGLDTRLGTEFDGVDLSGGQWQRVALSRAAMPGAPLLCVLDEPTAALDARGEYETYTHQMRLARRWAAIHGTITVIVSHRFWTVRAADWIVVLSRGRVTEQGTHDDLMASGGTYAGLYTLQSEAYGHITRGAQCPPTPKPA